MPVITVFWGLKDCKKEKTITVQFHLHEIAKLVKFMETENNPGGCVQRRKRSCVMDIEF
jgi:hypothetical protein